MIKISSHTKSVVRTGILTAIGAFTGALAITGGLIPTSVAQWKSVLLPAFGAALAAEIAFIKAEANSAITQQATNAVTEKKE